MKTTTTIVLVVIVTAVVAGVAGYLVKPTQSSGETTTITTTTTASGGASSAMKVGYLLIGPLEGSGWNQAEYTAFQALDEKYSEVETTYIEDVVPADVSKDLEIMFDQGVSVAFSTAFDFATEIADTAERYPDKFFYQHLESMGVMQDLMGGGWESPANFGLMFDDLHQAYYINGLLAGAITETNKLGYVLPYVIPETLRNLNAWTIGAKQANPDVEVKVILLGTWYDPPTETLATRTLIDWGADVLNAQMDSPAYIQAAQSYFEETGNKVYTFGTYYPQGEFGPDVVLSGANFNHIAIIEPLVLKALHGQMEATEHTTLIKEGSIVWGYDMNTQVNPSYLSELESKTVTDPALGSLNVYDLAMTRNTQFKDPRVLYQVFAGPIVDTDGNLRVEEGQVLSAEDFWVNLDWYVQGIIPP